MLEEGSVVRSLAGRDKKKLMLIVSASDNVILVCDGKERPLERPKLKNPKHLEQTEFSIDKESALTNRALKKALANLYNECSGGT